MTPQQQAHIMMMRHQMTMGGPSGQPGQGKPGVTHPTGAQSVGMPMHPNQMHPPQQPVCGATAFMLVLSVLTSQ
jgi:hypothetical protein